MATIGNTPTGNRSGPDGPTVVIGLTDPHRDDEGVGPAVVSRLRRRHLPGVRLVDCAGAAGQLLELWQDARMAVVVDTLHAESARPGVVHRRSLRHPSLQGRLAASSHAVDLGWAVALAESLDRLPSVLLLFAIGVAEAPRGAGPSPAVAAAVDRVAAEIAQTTMRSARRAAVAWSSMTPIGNAD